MELTQSCPHERQRRASLLVRCWVEDGDGGAQVLRGWIRNLHTGREQLFGDASLVGSILAQELRVPEAK